MRVVPRLDGAENVNRGNIRPGEGAIVHDLFDARASGRDFRREISETARTIADDGSEAREAAIGYEAAFDDPAQDVGIDIAAAEKKNDAFAGELWKLSGKAGSERRCRGAFDDTFFQLNDAQNRDGDLFFTDNNDAIDERRRGREGIRADLRDRETVRESRLHLNADRFSSLDRSGKAGDVIRLDRDHFCLGPQCFYGERHTGKQSAAANRNDDRIEIGDLLENLQTHRALSRDNRRIVIAIDVSEPAFLRDLVRLFFRFAEILSVQHDCRAELLAIGHFDQRGVLGHHHRRWYAENFALIPERLSMVSG